MGDCDRLWFVIEYTNTHSLLFINFVLRISLFLDMSWISCSLSCRAQVGKYRNTGKINEWIKKAKLTGPPPSDACWNAPSRLFRASGRITGPISILWRCEAGVLSVTVSFWSVQTQVLWRWWRWFWPSLQVEKSDWASQTVTDSLHPMIIKDTPSFRLSNVFWTNGRVKWTLKHSVWFNLFFFGRNVGKSYIKQLCSNFSSLSTIKCSNAAVPLSLSPSVPPSVTRVDVKRKHVFSSRRSLWFTQTRWIVVMWTSVKSLRVTRPPPGMEKRERERAWEREREKKGREKNKCSRAPRHLMRVSISSHLPLCASSRGRLGVGKSR